MAFRQKVAKYLGNHAETNEKHIDPSLRTHYYKTTKDKGVTMLESLFKNDAKYEINALSKERGEISANAVKGKKAFIVGTVIMVGPFKTAIDFSVTTDSVFPFDFGYSTKLIHQMYGKINKELERIENVS